MIIFSIIIEYKTIFLVRGILIFCKNGVIIRRENIKDNSYMKCMEESKPFFFERVFFWKYCSFNTFTYLFKGHFFLPYTNAYMFQFFFQSSIFSEISVEGNMVILLEKKLISRIPHIFHNFCYTIKTIFI